MKVRLVSGAEFDVLTREELRGELAEHRAQLDADAAKRSRPCRWIRTDQTETTDGNGDVAAFAVHRVPNGCTFELARVVLEVDGYDPNNSTPAGGFAVYRGSVLVSPVPGPLPNVAKFTEGGRPRFRNGEEVTVQVYGAPANVNVTASLEGAEYVGEG